MTSHLSEKASAIVHLRNDGLSLPAPGFRAIASMKDRQSRKIRELKATLLGLGFATLDEQARVLGLGRSSAWSILKGNHKASGLSAMTINRLLRAPKLPEGVRIKILEYVFEKATGRYGHSELQQRRFVAQLSEDALGHTDSDDLVL